MSQQLKIAAIFATMNRVETAVSCVKALAVQTRPPDLVVVADNVSSDCTVADLEALSPLPFRLIVHRMPENRGNAGGIEVAMDLAFEQGADAVWILDDDSWPREGALEALLRGNWNPEVVRHSVQIDPRTGAFTWPLQIERPDGGRYFCYRPEEIPSAEAIRSKRMWTGSLISREVRNEVGRVNAGLFIRGEDEEYPWRIAAKGFGFLCHPNSVIDHPGPVHVTHWSILGKHFFFERGLADWKLYYKVRNMVWLALRQSGWTKSISSAMVHVVAAICIDGPSRLPLTLEAVWDGLVGRLGKWRRHGS